MSEALNSTGLDIGTREILTRARAEALTIFMGELLNSEVLDGKVRDIVARAHAEAISNFMYTLLDFHGEKEIRQIVSLLRLELVEVERDLDDSELNDDNVEQADE